MTIDQSDTAFENAKPLASMVCKLARAMTTPDEALIALTIALADVINNLQLEEGATREDVLDGIKASIVELNQQFDTMRNVKHS